MVDAGLLRSGGPGVWELTRTGYEALDAFRAALAASEAESAEAESVEAESADVEPPTA